MLVLEWLFIGTARFGAQKRIGVDVLQRFLEKTRSLEHSFGIAALPGASGPTSPLAQGLVRVTSQVVVELFININFLFAPIPGTSMTARKGCRFHNKPRLL